MNIADFFAHWSIAENPFRGEEARHDGVFARMGLTAPGPPAAAPNQAPPPQTPASPLSRHAEFDKILGELLRPTTSVVFGEKGSGKTAIRMQIADHTAAHNAANPDGKTFLVPYDDLNRFIAELDARYGTAKEPLAAFRKARLADHMDAMLSVAVDRLVAALLGESAERPAADVGAEAPRLARLLSPAGRRDLLLLQALYDPNDADGSRTARLRRMLRLGPPKDATPRAVALATGWIPAVALIAWLQGAPPAWFGGPIVTVFQALVILLIAGYLAVVIKAAVVNRWLRRRAASRIRAETRSLARSGEALAASLAHLDPPELAVTNALARAEGDEPRFELFARLARVLRRFGYTGTLVLVDRVDEPTLINGDADKMRELMWPLFNNKFLQQESFGVKMLLPIELRHALFRESSAFFQEARLDKQSLVERLTWTGPMLYDLCNARLDACRRAQDGAAAEPIALADLFDDDVSRQDVVDALDQMHQPRDAFKFLYRCINEHCSNVTADEGKWRIPKPVLDTVRRAESDRVQQLYRGIRPA